MHSIFYNYNKEIEIKNNILKKQHSDSLNCLIYCAEYKFTLQIIQDPKIRKSNLFYIFKGENISSPLFFYNMASNEIIESIENKNISENIFISSQKIKSENEIINNFEQNKKKQILFNHLKYQFRE